LNDTPPWCTGQRKFENILHIDVIIVD